MNLSCPQKSATKGFTGLAAKQKDFNPPYKGKRQEKPQLKAAAWLVPARVFSLGMAWFSLPLLKSWVDLKKMARGTGHMPPSSFAP